MDTRSEQQLQQQINKIKQDIVQKEQEQKKFIYNIYGILYSGNNFDQNGNKTLNPAIGSVSKYIKHGNIYEQVMNIARSTGWWESLTYPGEYVFLLGDVVTKRFDQWKSLYADFDYRFCPIKEIDFNFKTIFEKKRLEIQDFNEQIFGISFDNLVYDITQYNYDICKNRIENIFDYLNENDQDKKVNQLLELTQLSFPSKTYIISSSNYDKIDNILKNAIQNVYISESQNVYLNPNGFHKNINIQNSSNVCLMGNQNVLIQFCENIYIGESNEQGKVELVNVNNFYVKESFCNNGSQFMFYNSGYDKFCCIGKNTFQSSNIIFSNIVNCDIVIKDQSFNYSQGILSNISNAQIMCENRACENTEINIKDSFNEGYLHLTQFSCINGLLQIGPNSFNSSKSICSFRSSLYSTEQQLQSLICPEGIKIFYMNKLFKELELLKGTQYVIQGQNKVQKSNGEIVNDDGPFDLPQILFNSKEKQYLLPSVIQKQTDCSNWFGYYLLDKNTQTFSNWGNLPLGKWLVEDLIVLRYKNESKDFVIKDKILQQGGNILNVIVDNVDLDYLSVEKIQLFINYSIKEIKLNGQSIPFNNTTYNIYIDNDCTSNVFLQFSGNTKIIQIRGGKKLQSFNFQIGELNQDKNVLDVDILVDLIQKMNSPSQYLFKNCKQFNPIRFVQSLPKYSQGMFYGVDFSNYEKESISFIQQEIPEYCFYQSIWNNQVTKCIFQNTTTFKDCCFSQLNSNINEILFNSQLNSIGIQQFSKNSQLQKVYFMFNGIEIQQSMFEECDQLNSVFGNILSIKQNAFYNCKTLNQIDLTQCETIGENSFVQTKIQQLTLNKIQYIKNGAFSQCEELKIVKLGKTFNKIFEERVFEKCLNLQYIYFMDLMQSIIVDVYQEAFSYTQSLIDIVDINNKRFDIWFNINGSYSFQYSFISRLYLKTIANNIINIFKNNQSKTLLIFYDNESYIGGFEYIQTVTTIKVRNINTYNILYNMIQINELIYKNTNVVLIK